MKDAVNAGGWSVEDMKLALGYRGVQLLCVSYVKYLEYTFCQARHEQEREKTERNVSKIFPRQGARG